jgi:hypothetical protein
VDTKHSHEHDSPAGELRHEVRDVSVRSVALFGVGLAALIVVSIALMFGLFKFLENREEALDSKPAGIMAERPKEPPQPRLQTSPVPTLKQILANENALLTKYEWINEKTGSVRIPVRRAMELLAERGLPARAANETEKRGDREVAKTKDGEERSVPPVEESKRY